jgi:HSP20 family molecular chaperone IbpA
MSGGAGERDVGGMLERLGERIESAVLEGIGRTASRVQERKPLSADVLESDDAFLIVFDAPGVTAADVDVRFDEGTVSVHLDRFRELYDGFEMRVPGRGLSLEGQAELPAATAVDPSAAEATITKNGTLQVEIPKTEEASRSVAVGETADEPVDIGGEIDDDSGAVHDETPDSDADGVAVEETEESASGTGTGTGTETGGETDVDAEETDTDIDVDDEAADTDAGATDEDDEHADRT